MSTSTNPQPTPANPTPVNSNKTFLSYIGTGVVSALTVGALLLSVTTCSHKKQLSDLEKRLTEGLTQDLRVTAVESYDPNDPTKTPYDLDGDRILGDLILRKSKPGNDQAAFLQYTGEYLTQEQVIGNIENDKAKRIQDYGNQIEETKKNAQSQVEKYQEIGRTINTPKQVAPLAPLVTPLNTEPVQEQPAPVAPAPEPMDNLPPAPVAPAPLSPAPTQTEKAEPFYQKPTACTRNQVQNLCYDKVAIIEERIVTVPVRYSPCSVVYERVRMPTQVGERITNYNWTHEDFQKWGCTSCHGVFLP